MGTIAEKLEYLNGTKDAIKAAIEGKGVTVPDGTTFRGYADLIGGISGGSGTYQEKTATPTGEQFDVLPDDGYDAMSKVTVAGDSALKPWNIPEGTTIYGVVGTAKLAVTTDPPADLPVSKDDADAALEENDATADTSAYDLMVLAQDDGNITYCYLDKGNRKCLYNGVELPNIDTVWTDKTTYPYVIISSKNGEIQSLYTSTVDFYSNGSYICASGKGRYVEFKLNNDIWDEYGPTTVSSGFQLFRIKDGFAQPFWANFDIYYDDTVYLAASAPVPSGGFTITDYDPITTEFKAKGWRRLSYHTTGEQAGTWSYDDFTDTESSGWNYLKNIRSCTREKLYYNDVEVWPVPFRNATWETLFDGTVKTSYIAPYLHLADLASPSPTLGYVFEEGEVIKITVNGTSNIFVAEKTASGAFYVGNYDVYNQANSDEFDGYPYFVKASMAASGTNYLFQFTSRESGTYAVTIEKEVR